MELLEGLERKGNETCNRFSSVDYESKPNTRNQHHVNTTLRRLIIKNPVTRYYCTYFKDMGLPLERFLMSQTTTATNSKTHAPIPM